MDFLKDLAGSLFWAFILFIAYSIAIGYLVKKSVRPFILRKC